MSGEAEVESARWAYAVAEREFLRAFNDIERAKERAEEANKRASEALKHFEAVKSAVASEPNGPGVSV